ncbi:MAG TPA: hypothetical protein VFZ75_05385 [Actinomycetota bacterium]|nr:hypothetical protein [Actinomycetota bacterium]
MRSRDPEGAETPAQRRVPAEAYVTDVVTTFRDDVEALSEELQRGEDPSSLDVVKDAALSYFDDVIASTDRMVAEAEAAGVPDVADGEEAARQVSTALGEMRSALTDARDRMDGLSIEGPQAFASELQSISEDMKGSLDEVAGSLDSFEAPSSRKPPMTSRRASCSPPRERRRSDREASHVYW